MLARFDRFCHAVNLGVEFLLALMVATTVGVTFVQVVCRYGFDSSLSWSEEAARYLFVWIIFLGSSSAARRGQHMAVDVISGMLPPAFRKWPATLVLLVGFVFFLTFGLLALRLAENAATQLSAGLQIPVSWVYAAGPAGALLILLQLFNGMLRSLAGLDRAEQAQGTAPE